MSKKPVADYDQFQLRLPPGMRERIADSAERNNRSMNAEIISILEMHYPPPKQIDDLILRLKFLQYDAKKKLNYTHLIDIENVVRDLTEMLGSLPDK